MEQDKGSEEQVVTPTPNEEQGQKSTPEETKDSTSETTPEFTEEQEAKIAERISVAKGEVQSAKDTEITTERRKHREELRNLKATQEQERLEVLKKSQQDRLGETDPDLLKELQDLQDRIYATATDTGDVQAHGYAYKLGKEYGVDPELLLDSGSKEEMETKAKELTQVAKAEAVKAKDGRIKELEEELAKAKKAPQKVDSSATDVPGVDLSKLSPREQTTRALDKLRKK